MQDNSTGHMHALELERFPRNTPVEPMRSELARLERAKDAVLPRARQGAVIRVGEEFTLNGGRFVVTSIVKEGVFLKGLPAKA